MTVPALPTSGNFQSEPTPAQRPLGIRRRNVGQQCDCVHHLETGPVAMSTCVRCFGTGLTDPRRDKTLERNRELRRPTAEEMTAFTGAHCRHLYASLAHDWRCPGCHRTKYELMRWTMLFPKSPHRYRGWAVGLHQHHDHGHDHGRPARFPRTVVCEQCNSADTAAKRELGIPDVFSFSPAEISRFVIGTPHGWHLLNYAAAARKYAAACACVPPPPAGLFWRTGGSR